jgi:hypothetical protein
MAAMTRLSLTLNPMGISHFHHLVYDHPMNIAAKFDSNLFCGFRKKDENVKFP